MANNVNFQIPFLGGGPSISEQILAGLHQGAVEQQRQQELGLEQQRVKSETIRNDVLNQLTQAQIQHEANVSAFEKETNPIKRAQILNDLQDSALKLGIAKHQAKYFGIDADALTNAATPEGITPSTPKTTGTSTAPTGPTPFEQEMQRTEGLLGPMTPEEKSIWENAKSVAAKSLSATPITAAIAKISENRQAIHKAELETTPFKSWQAKFIKEKGREPTADEIEKFQTAGQALRIAGMENLRQDNYLDTSVQGGEVRAMTAGEFAAANKEEPGRFVKDTGQVRNALKATSLIADIRDGIKQMRDANNALPKGGLSTAARSILELSSEAPEGSKVPSVMAALSGNAAKSLSKEERHYLIAHATLTERAMALRGLQGQGAGSDQQRAAIVAMLPGFTTADKEMGEEQLKTLENNVENVNRSVPKIGKMNKQSAGEASREGELKAEDLLKKYPPKTE